MENLPLEIITDETDYQTTCRNLRLHGEYPKHIVRECSACGWLEWSSSSLSDGRVIEIWPMERECQRCYVVQLRNPEVYAWVIGVMIKAERDAMRREQVEAKRGDGDKPTA